MLFCAGRFGKFYEDDLSCMAPLLQCCLIRQSTFQRLVRMYRGPVHLSGLMNESMSADPVAPIVVDDVLTALDRRVVKVLREVWECTESPDLSIENGDEVVERTRTFSDVIIDDGVY